MKKKELKLLELQDDENGIKALLEKETKNEVITIYTDYRDFNDIEKLVANCKTQYDFEDEIIECYSELEAYSQQDLIDKIIDKVEDKYSEYDGITEELNDYIRDYVCETVPVKMPIQEYLNQRIRVNMFITFGNSTDAETDELDYKTLSEMLKRLDYVHPKTTIKELKNGEYKGDDAFLNSLQEEILNSYREQYNYLTFIGEITVGQYYKILENPYRTRIQFTHNNCAGFVDPYNGGGSVLGINLPKDKPLSCKGQNVRLMLIENSGYHYTVDSIYGLTSNCYQPIEVK